MKKVFIGTDHAGFELKEKLVPFLKELGYEVEDKGAFKYDENDDYPDYIKLVAQAVMEGPDSEERKGIVLGGSGEGEEISANKIGGIRAAEYYGGNLEIVKLARQHNNANVLSLGARFISEVEAKDAVKLFLQTDFSGEERHVRRINKIEPIEPDPA